MGSQYEVEVTVGSARDLKNVNWRNGDLKPYAVLWIDAGARCSTRVDLDGAGENPSWDEKVVVPLPPASRLQDAVLYIDVVHANAAEGVKPLVGSARLLLRDVLDDAGIGGNKVSRSLKLKRPSGRPQGKVDVRVAVREPSRYYDPNPGGYPAPAGYGSNQPAGPYGGYGAAAGAGGYGAYAVAAPPAGYPAYGSTAPPPQAAAPYGSVPPPYGTAPPPTQAAAYGSAPPAYGTTQPTGQAGYGSASPGYGSTGVALEQSGGKKKKGMSMGTGLAVGAAAGVLGGLALAGGASYVEHKIEDRVADRVEEDIYGGDDDY